VGRDAYRQAKPWAVEAEHILGCVRIHILRMLRQKKGRVGIG